MRTTFAALGPALAAYAIIAFAPDIGSGNGGPVPLGATLDDPPSGDYIGSDPSQQVCAIADDADSTAHEETTSGPLARRQLDSGDGHGAQRQMA